MARPAMGVRWGGEACAVSRPRGGGSRESRRRLFKRLEQEERRLKKHDGRWMDIIRSLGLEPCILTKLTSPPSPST